MKKLVFTLAVLAVFACFYRSISPQKTQEQEWNYIIRDIRDRVQKESQLIGSLDLWMKKIILEKLQTIDAQEILISDKISQAIDVVQEEQEKNNAELKKAEETPGYYTGYLARAQQFLNNLKEKLEAIENQD